MSMQTRRLPLPDDVLENVETPQVSDNTSPARTLQDTGPAQPAQAQSTTNDQQAPNIPSTPSLTDYNIIKTSAGNIYVKTESGWQKLEYNPQSNSYSLASVDFNDIFSEVNRLGGTGYKVEPQLAEKLAREEPHVLMWYGVEDALRYAKLKETFPELQKEKWITEADVQNVITQRLESYGWKPDTREKYDALKSLSESVFRNPEVWTEVEKDINRQLAEAKPKIEELQRFYEAKALKQLDAEHEVKIQQQYSDFYKSLENQHWFSIGLESLGANFVRTISFGLINPPPSPFETAWERYTELANKPLEKPLIDLTGFLPKPLKDLDTWLRENFGFRPNPNLLAPIAREQLVGQEKTEFETLEKVLTLEKRIAYAAGYGLGSFIAFKSMNIIAGGIAETARFAKWEFTSNEALLGKTLKDAGIELKTPEFLANISEKIKAKTLSIGEKAGLVEKVQYVPAEVDFALMRTQMPDSEAIASKVEFTKWAKAEEVLGKTVPESMKLQPGEVSMLPIDVGGKTVNAPIVGEGEFGVVGGEKFAYMNKGLKLKEPFFFYGKGTGEESFLFARLSKETGELVAPRYDFLRLEGKVAYQKVFEQAMGGMPKAILYTEEMGVVLGFSRTPKIPVLEKYTTPLMKDILPLSLPLYLHPPLPRTSSFGVEEFDKEKRSGGTPTEPKIQIIEDYRTDIITPVQPTYTPPAVFQPVMPRIGDITAVAPRIGEIAVPKVSQVAQPKIEVRAEPRIGEMIGEIAVPKLKPKINIPPQNIPDHPPPDNRIQPKLPPLPSLGGTRDLPSPRSLKMYSRKIWQETWFGDIGFGSGGRRGRGRGGKRGGRR